MKIPYENIVFFIKKRKNRVVITFMPPAFPLKAAILDCLGQVLGENGAAGIQVCNRPGYFKDPVVSTG